MMGTSENDLSVVTVKALFFCLALVFAGLTIVTTLAQSFEIAFHVYADLSLITAIILFIASVFIVRRWFFIVERKDYAVLACILAIGIVGAMLALFMNLHDTDDYYYIPNAVYHLTNPDKPMDYLIHYVWSGSKPFHSYSHATAVTYDYFQSLVAYFLHIPYLDSYYIMSPPVTGFLVPLAYFLAFSYFTDRSDEAVIGAMVVLGLLILLGETRDNLAQYTYARIYQARSVLLTLSPPLFAAASLSYFKRANFVHWLTLFCVTTVFTRVSTTSSLFLLILAVGLCAAYLSMNRSKSAIPILFKYFLAMGFYALWMLYIFPEARNLVGRPNPLPINSFGGNVMLMINKNLPLFAIFAAASSCLSVLMSSGKQRTFLAVWIISTLVLFFNRIMGTFWVHQLSSPYSPNVYWRLFFAYPFPFTAGITVMRFFERFRIVGSYARFGAGIAVAVITCVLVVTVPISMFRNPLVRIGCCMYKLPPSSLAQAREIVTTVPSGVMLAPRKLSGIITTLDPRFQQIVMYKDSLRFWCDQQGRGEEAETRIRAMEFLEGSTNDLSRLQIVIAKYPVIRSILLTRTSLDNKEVSLLLQKYGFMTNKSFGEYVVVWRNLN